jgi:PKD repeat protein
MLSGVSVDWGDGTVTHPSPTATSDTHIYRTTGYFESQVFTINLTATNSGGQTFATASETVNDRPATLTINNPSPNPANTGQTITLNFNASDLDGTVLATWIDWGDGSPPDLILNETSSSMCQRLNPSLHSDACTLAPGDLLFGQPTDPSTILNGSIMIFRPYPAAPSFLVAHRVIKIIPATGSIYNEITFWTEGDANAVPDAWDQAGGGIPGTQVVAVYQYTLPEPSAPSARSDTHTYSSVGDSQSKTFTIRVNATDNNGLVSFQTLSEVIIDMPPILTIKGLSPTPANSGQPVTISFSAADTDGTVSSLTVNWGDGSSTDILSASATSDTHSYSRAGSFTIVITARDNSGSTTHVSSLPVAVTAPPTPASPAPTILGLAPIEFYTLIGIIATIIVTAVFLSLRRSRKP